MKQAYVHLPQSVLEQMILEAERAFPKESGGALMGYRDVDDEDLIQVVDQIGPGPRAIHQTHRFEPDGKWQARQIASAYQESGRVVTYLGDWHSHPRGSSTPSSLDRSTARDIARCEAARAPNPLILIAFGRPEIWDVAVYRRQRWRLRPADIELGQ